MEQEKFTDEEMSDFVEMFNCVLKSICTFSDKHNFDRDNILKYFSQRLECFSEIATISEYQIN